MAKKKHHQQPQSSNNNNNNNNNSTTTTVGSISQVPQAPNAVDEVQCAKLAVWATAAVKDYTTGKRWAHGSVPVAVLSAAVLDCYSAPVVTAGLK